MISLKKYLDQEKIHPIPEPGAESGGLLPAAVAAYRSALCEMGAAGLEVCPAAGEELSRGLADIEDSLSQELTSQKLESAEQSVQSQLYDWRQRASRHNRQKTDEVKEILIVMARAAESVGERDQRAAGQIAQVTGRLKKIATLEDLSQIRTSIEESAAELKTSIDRMAAESRAAIQQLKSELSVYQARVEEAERVASTDSMTGLRSRFWMEKYIERRIGEDREFCIVIVDIDDFKRVNDELGHPVGDELLKQFSAELKSAFRSNSVVSRWGGDEFIVLLDCGLDEARTQVSRLKKWVCGAYSLQGRSGPVKLNIDASAGAAERRPGETMKRLLDRADTDMYAQKAAARTIDARSIR
jgi:diguanylate cyclase (GGDEF)-like protein